MAATALLSTSGASGLPAATGLAAGPQAKRTKRVRVPPKVSIGDVTLNSIGTLRSLNAVLFPVRYSDRFYKEVLEPELEDYCKYAYYNDIPVGAICCRIELDEATKKADSTVKPVGKLYLMTLGVLAPYRRQGLATQLLEHVYQKATEASRAAEEAPLASAQPANVAKGARDKKDKAKGKATEAASATQAAPAKPAPILKSIFVHVQVSNDDSKAFWLQQGFEEKETVKDYYKKDVEGPRDAWLLEKPIVI